MFFLFAGFVAAADRATKLWALAALPYGQSAHALPGVFQLTLIDNRGVAFGFFDSHPRLLFFLISVSLCFLGALVWTLWREKKLSVSTPLFWALALVTGGALGNLIDRVSYGAVIDFVDLDFWPLENWPVFNLADSAISLGIVLYLFASSGKRS